MTDYKRFEIDDTAALMAEFHAICETGGRFSGSDSEKRAVAHLKARIEALFGHAPTVIHLVKVRWTMRPVWPSPCR